MNCTHPTNEKDGLCVICRNPNKFGVGNSAHIADTHLDPASRPIAKKQNQGSKRGQAGTDLSHSNKKLKLFAKAQISYLLSLAYQGNMPVLIRRLHLLRKELTTNKGNHANR